MDRFEKFNETSLPEKEEFYSNLDMEDADNMSAERVFKDFKIKNLSVYHDLHLKIDTLLLANVFEAFRKMCLKVYQLVPAFFVSTPGLAWQAPLKKTKVKLELLTNDNML